MLYKSFASSPCWPPPLSWQQLRFHRCSSAFAEQEDKTIVYENNYLRTGVINIKDSLPNLLEKAQHGIIATTGNPEHVRRKIA